MGISAIRLSCAIAAVLPAVALAQTPPVKPGLWEVTSARLGAGGQPGTPPGDRLKNLPPEQRARIEAMMKEKGVAIGPGGTTKVCFTKESMDPARFGNTADCKTDYASRTASSWKWHSVCSQPAIVVDGEAVFASPEKYTVNTSSTMTMHGETKTTQRSIQAHWLGSDCGDLKPFDPKR